MKKLTGIAVLLAVIVINTYASPTAGVTNGLFLTPQDDYMSVQWYPRVGLEKFFATTWLGSDVASLGFAAKAGGALYIGVSYSGDLFNQVDIGYTETNASFNGGTVKTFKNYNDDELRAVNYSGYRQRPNHGLSVLIGAADMGFRFDFSSSYQLFEIKEDSVIKGALTADDTSVKSAKYEGGSLSPSFTWGMAKDLTPNGIRPRISLSFDFSIDSTELEPYIGAVTLGKLIDTDNSTGIGLSFNLGGFTINRTNSGFTTSVDFTYSFYTRIYADNQFSWFNEINNKIVTEKKKGHFYDDSTALYFMTDVMGMNHIILPSLKVTWDSKRAGLGARLDLPVTINSSGNTRYIMNNYSGVFYEYEKLDSTSSIGVSFNPFIYLGCQFRVVPEKFNINIGAGIDLSKIGQSEKETKDFIDDTNLKEVDASTGGTDSFFSVGASLFLTKNVSLDAYTGVRSDRSFNITNSITYFSNILLSLKF